MRKRTVVISFNATESRLIELNIFQSFMKSELMKLEPNML